MLYFIAEGFKRNVLLSMTVLYIFCARKDIFISSSSQAQLYSICCYIVQCCMYFCIGEEDIFFFFLSHLGHHGLGSVPISTVRTSRFKYTNDEIVVLRLCFEE